MPTDPSFDFWYAVNNTEVLLRPRQQLETFGHTMIRYHLVSELMDAVDKVRVREGAIQAYRPQILTAQDLEQTTLEGFGESEAERYVQWLRDHEQDLLILKYGFRIRKQPATEQIISDRLELVVDRVRKELEARDHPLNALVLGVDEPWEVCLLKLMVEMIQHASAKHVADLRADPDGSKREIEAAFRAAARDRNQLNALADLLRRRGKFKDYEDRFFALVQRPR